MEKLDRKEWLLVLISSVVSVLLSRYLPEQSVKIFNLEPVDIILTTFIFAFLIIIYINIFLWVFGFIDRVLSKLFPNN